MYTKKIKRGKKTYSYYYHNVKEGGRVKNIFLGNNKEDSIKKLNEIKEDKVHKSLLDSAPSPIKEKQDYKITEIVFLLAVFSLGLGIFYFINNVTTYATFEPNPTFDPSINTTDVNVNNTNVNLSLDWLSNSAGGIFNITGTWYENNASILLLNMPFDANSSDIKDYSTLNNNGTIFTPNTNVTWNTTGCKINGCYNFNGFNSLVNITNLVNLGLTQELWVRNSTSSTFTHLVNNSGQLYANGALVDNASHKLPISNKTNSVRIGVFNNEEYFNGTIDEVRIWNKTLSQNQILQNYNDGIANFSIKTLTNSETTRLRTYKASLVVANRTSLGNFTNTSEVLIRNSIPSIPLINLPLNSTWIPNNSFFEINNSDEVDDDQIYYILEVDDAFAFSSINFYNGTLRKSSNSSNSFNFSLGLSDGVYYFRAKATDLNDNSSYSEIRNFTLDATFPYNLTLISPANSTESGNRTPLLIWNDTIEANFDNYTIQIDDDRDFSSVQFTYNITNDINRTTLQITNPLNDNTVYYWKVIAVDLANNQNSSTFIYTTLTSGGPGISGTSGSSGAGGGGGGGRTLLADVEIIDPGLLTMYSEDTILAPIFIRNNGVIVLNGISLEATTNSSDLSFEFDRTFIPIVLPNNEEKVLLKIISHTDPGQYEVTIKATITNPPITDTSKIIISLLESESGEKGSAQKQLEFSKRLFEENPDCFGLNDLLIQAEDAINKEQYEKALSLADSAIQSCKELVTAKGKELKNVETPKANQIATLVVELLAAGFIGYGIYYYYKRRRIKLR